MSNITAPATIHKTKKSVAKRLIIIMIIVAVTLPIISMSGAAVFFNLYFARYDGEEYSVFLRFDDLDDKTLYREPVEFKSGGNTLRGYLYGDGTKGLVIMVNGFHSGADRHLTETMYFVDKGWRVMTFDGSGYFSSDGNSVMGLSYMRNDLKNAIDYIKSGELASLPLMLYGHSAGAYAVASILSEAEGINGAVCLAAFDTAVETMIAMAGNFVGFLADTQYPFLYLQNQISCGDGANISSAEQIRKTKTPVMVVQGNEDKVVTKRVSLFSKIENEQIDLVTLVPINEEYRNTHSSLWLSHDAGKYLYDTEKQADEIKKNYSGSEKKEKLDELYESIDRFKINEVNEEFMNSINEFFEKTITK